MPMKKKRHPMQPPYNSGDLFAVQITPDAWGYCRMWRGMGIEIPPVYTRTPGIPDVEWAPATPPKWLFRINLAVREIDRPVILPVGNVPFASEEQAVMPPTYRDPDNIEPRYTIEERGIYRYTNDPADLKGIAKAVRLVPETLGVFLKEKYVSGELREVGVQASLA